MFEFSTSDSFLTPSWDSHALQEGLPCFKLKETTIVYQYHSHNCVENLWLSEEQACVLIRYKSRWSSRWTLQSCCRKNPVVNLIKISQGRLIFQCWFIFFFKFSTGNVILLLVCKETFRKPGEKRNHKISMNKVHSIFCPSGKLFKDVI